MKRAIILTLVTTIVTSSFALANVPDKVDSTIGTLDANQPLAEFVVDMTKLKDTLSKQKQVKQSKQIKPRAMTSSLAPMTSSRAPLANRSRVKNSW